MSRKLSYPPKPWKDGQTHNLQPGITFAYSISLRKWVPMSPGYGALEQIQTAFGVSSLEELKVVFETKVELAVEDLDSEIKRGGRIWKTTGSPPSPHNNDLWYEKDTGAIFSYDALEDTWVEIKYS